MSDLLANAGKYKCSSEEDFLVNIVAYYKQQIKKIVERTEFLSSSKEEELAIYDKML